MTRFNHLNVPTHWESYWTKYPEGYTILEALINWVSQVDAMVDNQNKLNAAWDEFIGQFDKDLQSTVSQILSDWQNSGFLDTVIDNALTTGLTKMKDKNPLYLTDYVGADKTGTTVSTAAFKAALSDAATQKRKLIIPTGTFHIDAAVVQNISGDVTIEGEDMFGSVLLWRGGAAIFLNLTNGRNILLKNLSISGRTTGDAVYFDNGSTGLKVQGSLIMENVYLNGFGTLSQWDGGYYHKFTNCEFRWSKQMFKGYNANNLTFDKCKAQDFENFLEVVAGSGPVTFTGGSIEKWVGYAFRGTSGSAAILNIENSYFENYPNLTPPTGIVGEYKAAFVASGFGAINMTGNQFTVNGIRRVVFGTSVLRHVTSKGNRIDYTAGTTSDLEWFIYQAGTTLETCEALDIAYNILTQSGLYTAGYLSNLTGLKAASSKVYDPFTKQQLTLLA